MRVPQTNTGTAFYKSDANTDCEMHWVTTLYGWILDAGFLRGGNITFFKVMETTTSSSNRESDTSPLQTSM